MGLDMYFYARQQKFNSFFKDGKDLTNYPRELNVLANYIKLHNFKSTTITTKYQIGYFRKFEDLHEYIVNNYGDGIDECQEIYLSKEDIQELYNDCFTTIKSDDNDAGDIAAAQLLFELILETIDFDKYDIVYEASW